MQLNDDIINAKMIINGFNFNVPNQIFHKNSSIYKFTNENVSGYYDLLKPKDKTMLTVCASTDHVLEAIARDVKKVDCFDISTFTKYFMNLKISACLSLEYKEFIDYFFNRDDFFSEKYYSKIRNYLKKIDDDSLLFWDSLYNMEKGFNIYSSKLFESCHLGVSLYANNKSSYLNKENFYILKRKLEKYLSINDKVLFKQVNIVDIHNCFKDKYDLIILSNIADYMYTLFDNDIYYNFYNLITKEITKLLNNNGEIQVSYLYFRYSL